MLGTTWWQRLGFNAYSGGDDKLGRARNLSERNRYGGVRVPHWFVMLLTGPPALLYLRRLGALRRRHRIRRGLCGRCGYDLRATGGRCPECGEPVPARAGATAAAAA